MNKIEDLIGGRHFANAIITWKIKRFSLINITQKIISSPRITLVGPAETMWMLHLQSFDNLRKVALRLEMLQNDTRIRKIKLWCMHCFLDDKDEFLFSPERAFSFEPKCTLTLRIFHTRDLLELSNRRALDDLIFKCRILINFDLRIIFPKPRIAGIMELSNDLSTLPMSFLHHDITTTVGNVDFSLHKAMLYQRGDKLPDLIEQSTSDMKVNFSFFDPRPADELFIYIYTGNLRYVLFNPSLTLSDYIDHLDIPELKGLYVQQKIEAVTDVQLKIHKCGWLIADFKTMTRTIAGPEFKVDDVNGRFQLSLTIKESKDNDLKSLLVETTLLDCEQLLALCLEFTCGKDENDILISRRINGVLTDKERLGVTLIENSPERQDFFKNDTIVLTVTVYVRMGDLLDKILLNERPTPTKINYERSFCTIPRILGNIRKSHDYSDFHFLIQEEEFKAHKFLVAARSCIFKELFRKHEGLVSVKISDIQKEVFEGFLSYLYIGIIAESDAVRLIELYNLAEQYKVCSLQDLTVSLLLKLVNDANMLRVFMFAVDNEEEELRQCAINYIVSRANILNNHPDMEWFSTSRPNLHTQIEGYLQRK